MDKHTDQPTTSGKPTKYRGSCHCGAIRYEVELDLADGATRCNCTLCQKTGVTNKAVKPDAFALIAGESELSMYECGAKVAQRYFCKHCGIHCFGRGTLEQLGGAFVGVNVSTLDDADPGALKIGYWDGRHNNWESGTRDQPWPVLPSS